MTDLRRLLLLLCIGGLLIGSNGSHATDSSDGATPEEIYSQLVHVERLIRQRQDEMDKLKVEIAKLKGNAANLDYVVTRMESIVAGKRMRLEGIRSGRGF